MEDKIRKLDILLADARQVARQIQKDMESGTPKDRARIYSLIECLEPTKKIMDRLYGED